MEPATFLLMDAESETPTARDRTPYEVDFHAWALEQAEAIKLGRFRELDVDNLADEVGDMARRVRQEFVSRLSLVLCHLMKWAYQPQRRSASWARTIKEQRRQLGDLLAEAPSLRPLIPQLVEEAFKQGRVAALNETGLDDTDIAEANPYSWDEAMTRPVAWPEP